MSNTSNTSNAPRVMRHYVIAYASWLAGVLTMAVIALAWYRHVEQVGIRELAARLQPDASTDADAPSVDE